MIQVPSIDPLERLRCQASALGAQAEEATRRYNRTTWFRFVLVFFPIPFVVVLLRLEMEAWAYYVAGALIVALGAMLYHLDSVASARADSAVRAAEKAQRAHEEARQAFNARR